MEGRKIVGRASTDYRFHRLESGVSGGCFLQGRREGAKRSGLSAMGNPFLLS
jgi:hypothetical protein